MQALYDLNDFVNSCTLQNKDSLSAQVQNHSLLHFKPQITISNQLLPYISLLSSQEVSKAYSNTVDLNEGVMDNSLFKEANSQLKASFKDDFQLRNSNHPLLLIQEINKPAPIIAQAFPSQNLYQGGDNLLYKTLLIQILGNPVAYENTRKYFLSKSEPDKTLNLLNYIEENQTSEINSGEKHQLNPKVAKIRFLNSPNLVETSLIIEKKKKIPVEDSQSKTSEEEEEDEHEVDEKQITLEDELFKPTKHCYYATKNSIKEKRVLTKRRTEIEKKSIHALPNNMEVLFQLICELETIFGYKDIDQEKVYGILLKSEMDPKKSLIRIRRNLGYYKRNLKIC